MKKALLKFGAIILAGLIVIGFIESQAWRQMNVLQQDFAAIQAESFLLGIRLQAGVTVLNGALLRFQLSGDVEERARFQTEARALQQWVANARSHLISRTEQDLLRQWESAFAIYLEDARPLLERGLRGIRRDTSIAVHQQISELSSLVVRSADALAAEQKASLPRFFEASESAIAALQRSQLAALMLQLGLLIVSATVVYRTMIAPLRTQLTESRELIERQEKLASLGTLAAGVAHEIRNPLTAVKFRLFSFKKALTPDLASHEDIVIIGNEINRLERIVKDFLDFARPSEPEPTLVPAGVVLEEVRNLMAPHLLKQAISLSVDAVDNPMLRVDRHQIQQVLINLLNNAAESMNGHGVIILRSRTGMTRLAGRSVAVAILEVTDNGRGMTPEVQRRIFDPFYSTREGGTGLGLSIALRIVEKHGGDIQFHSQVNKGTTFQIHLPLNVTDEIPDTTH